MAGIQVKICGLTNLNDTQKACELGADYIGFIFVNDTPRCVGRAMVTDIVGALPEDIKNKVGRVGLFKNEVLERVAETVLHCDLDHVQLHGEENPDYCAGLKCFLSSKKEIKIMKVFKVDEEILPAGKHMPGEYKDADYFVFDTFHPDVAGGTGKTFDWNILAKAKETIKKPFFIAGGLKPDIVSEVVRAVRPFGVDVSSGVETETGNKDGNLLKEFIQNAKKA